MDINNSVIYNDLIASIIGKLFKKGSVNFKNIEKCPKIQSIT